MDKILLIEPYYAGSHRQLIDLLHSELQTKGPVDLMTMTGKKWHWRARTSALHFSQIIPRDVNYRAIFASCVLPLHELLGLRLDLQNAKKIVYFHENQLVYPVRKSKDRDFQYGYNQILSCIVADVIVFNSKFNKDSFLSNLTKFFKVQPDYRPKHLHEVIEPKCQVLYFPLCFDSMIIDLPFKTPMENLPLVNDNPGDSNELKIYRILWNHRWEFDKNPELFFETLYTLVAAGFTNFRLSILGENFSDNLEIFTDAKTKLGEFIDHFGYLPSKADYYNALRESDIVISTAHHEFFGVSMMEAVYLGCYPLCPNRLVYPELFKSKECLFDSDEELSDKLKKILTSPNLPQQSVPVDFSLFDWNFLKSDYLKLFDSNKN